MLTSILLLVAGLALLYFGGEFLVQGSSNLALRFGVTPLLVGLTVVAFGTSSPELAVSMQAALGGVDDMALGNVVGSNICNLGLILALAALIKPIKVTAQVIRLDLPIMIGTCFLVPLVLWDGLISRLEGGMLFGCLIAYISFSIRLGRREKAAVQKEYAEAIHEEKGPMWHNVARILGGFVGLAAGGSLFVNGSVGIARYFGITEAVIGLTVVALGTSMPELATSAVAAFKGEGDIAIGNVIGSNIFNVLCILGLTAMVQPLRQGGITLVDMMVMAGIALVSLPLMHWGRRVGRIEGAVLLSIYLGYLFYLLH